MIKWANQHDPSCPVTEARASLLVDRHTMRDEVFLGCVREYDKGGDQEHELCECGQGYMDNGGRELGEALRNLEAVQQEHCLPSCPRCGVLGHELDGCLSPEWTQP